MEPTMDPSAPSNRFGQGTGLYGRLLLISPFFLWGTAMVAMKGILDRTEPLFLGGLRIVPAGLLVLAIAVALGRPQPRSWRAWGWVLAFALVDGAMFQGFLAQGLTRTTAGLGSVTIDSQPLAVALMARWLYGELIGPVGWLGLALGIGGIALVGLPEGWWGQVLGTLATRSRLTDLVSGGDGWTLDLDHLAQFWSGIAANGAWWMLLAALSMAVGTVMMRPLSRQVDPIVATGWHMILGGMPLLGLSAATELEQWQRLGLADWGAIAYATVLGSAASYGVFFYFASRGNLTSLSALTFLTPIFALVFGNLFLQETLSPVQGAGVLLTLLSIYLVNQREAIAARFRPGPSAPPPAPAQTVPDLPNAPQESAPNHSSGHPLR
ncbi:MAG: DMT family transporter [Cyanophyceae cyanobacterium]